MLSAAGRDHAMFQGKPEVFEAPTVHLDTVDSLPANATPLAHNDMGLQAASSDPGSMIYIGMQMVKRQLDEFLSNQKVVEIPADGLAFDHNVHEAIGTEVRPDLAEGTIVAVKRKGYKIAERLLRPATVVVSCLQEQGPA